MGEKTLSLTGVELGPGGRGEQRGRIAVQQVGVGSDKYGVGIRAAWQMIETGVSSMHSCLREWRTPDQMRFEEQQGTGRKGLSLSVRPACGELTSLVTQHGKILGSTWVWQPRTGGQIRRMGGAFNGALVELPCSGRPVAHHPDP